MTDSDLKQIASIMDERHYEKGAVIIEEKTKAERFFIIHRGKIEISKRFEGGEKAVLSVQSDGAFFGEMAILDAGRRSATVTAIEPTTVLEIHKEDFDSLLYKAPILAYRILHELSSRLRETGALLVAILTEKNGELYRAYIESLSMVLRTVESRNPLTMGHSRRIADLSLAVGRELRLGEEEMLILELSSLLHDLGMLSISEKLLEQPGPLEPLEYDLIKRHTRSSIELIDSIPLLQKTIPCILHHHEHFDGSGYPDGLAGKDIPLLSRILGVVDAFDSITSDRPGRKGRSPAEAREEIKGCSGTQFDPEVVKAFLKISASLGRAQHPRRRGEP